MKHVNAFVILISALVALGQPLGAHAFVAYETSPGVIELRSHNDHGLVVTRVQSKKVSKKSWTYFCVAEEKARAEKCFYADPGLFRNVRVGSAFASVEYGLRHRVHNNKGRIAIGSQRYFYPAYVLYELK